MPIIRFVLLIVVIVMVWIGIVNVFHRYGALAGIDVGIKDLLVCSDSTTFGNPRTLQRFERKLAKAQRQLSKRKKGSNNYCKQKLAIAKIHEKIANIRSDYTHKHLS